MVYALFVIVGVASFYAGYAWCWCEHAPLTSDDLDDEEKWEQRP